MKTKTRILSFLAITSLAALAGGEPSSLQSRADHALTAVSSLPSNGPEGEVKAMLKVALERVNAAQAVNCNDYAAMLLGDVEEALKARSDTLTAFGANTQTISALREPFVVSGNPYLECLVAGAKDKLSKPEKIWEKSTPAKIVFDGLGGERGSRDAAEEMQAWLWLYANPASPMKGSPEVLTRFLRLAHAYADAMDVLGGDVKLEAFVSKTIDSGPQAGKGIFDDFAIAPAACALREFAQLQPGLILPSQKLQWDRGMAFGGHLMYGKAKDRKGDYANIDIALSFELLNFGLYLNNQEYLDKSKFLAEVQEKNLYPDGAIAYLGHQNESHGYHDADTHYLAWIYELSGNPKILELLKKTEWYGPVTSGKLGEFWTVPSWKDTWNASGSPAGGEEIASITGNPYLRGICDAVVEKKLDPKMWSKSYAPLRWYRRDIKPLPLPDNYTVLDRNIAGPRAWYGRFNYAATLRSTPENEPGLATIMGMQVTDQNGRLGQVLMGVYPRVRFIKDEISSDGKFNRGAFAWRTCGLKSALVMGRTFSAVSGRFPVFGGAFFGQTDPARLPAPPLN